MMNATWLEFFVILAGGVVIGAAGILVIVSYHLVSCDLVVNGGSVKWKKRNVQN